MYFLHLAVSNSENRSSIAICVLEICRKHSCSFYFAVDSSWRHKKKKTTNDKKNISKQRGSFHIHLTKRLFFINYLSSFDFHCSLITMIESMFHFLNKTKPICIERKGKWLNLILRMRKTILLCFSLFPVAYRFQ